MIIRVNTLAEGVPSERSCEYDAGKIDVEFADLRYSTPVRFQANMCLESETLHIWGELSGQIEQVCARCLREIASPIVQPVDLIYDTHDIEEIDALEDVRAILILAHEPKFLCRPDCRGLCPGCGSDLNSENCLCAHKRIA
ncbi:MAG: DUF177 domain-containing protein [Candidatus Omnitrophica bacterium]|nr:DUF177 domain-containing protein [Candidatus Omnitrophota bacterium]